MIREGAKDLKRNGGPQTIGWCEHIVLRVLYRVREF
jgi:hypothetical protein